jgi:hypothetical protein
MHVPLCSGLHGMPSTVENPLPGGVEVVELSDPLIGTVMAGGAAPPA